MGKRVYISSPTIEVQPNRNHWIAVEACVQALKQGHTPVTASFTNNALVTAELSEVSKFHLDTMRRNLMTFCDECWLCGDELTNEMHEDREYALTLGLPLHHVGWDLLSGEPEKTYAIWVDTDEGCLLNGKSGFITYQDIPLRFGTPEQAQQKIDQLRRLSIVGRDSGARYRIRKFEGDETRQIPLDDITALERIKAMQIIADENTLTEITHSQETRFEEGTGFPIEVIRIGFPQMEDKGIWCCCDGDDFAAHVLNPYTQKEGRELDFNLTMIYRAKLMKDGPEDTSHWAQYIQEALKGYARSYEELFNEPAHVAPKWAGIFGATDDYINWLESESEQAEISEGELLIASGYPNHTAAQSLE